MFADCHSFYDNLWLKELVLTQILYAHHFIQFDRNIDSGFDLLDLGFRSHDYWRYWHVLSKCCSTENFKIGVSCPSILLSMTYTIRSNIFVSSCLASHLRSKSTRIGRWCLSCFYITNLYDQLFGSCLGCLRALTKIFKPSSPMKTNVIKIKHVQYYLVGSKII